MFICRTAGPRWARTERYRMSVAGRHIAASAG
jgi:hypothetical protein